MESKDYLKDVAKEIDFEKILRQKRSIVSKEIGKYLNSSFKPLIKKYSKGYPDLMDFHLNLVSEYPLRQGKYLRPSLVLLACQAMGQSEKKAIKTAAAMQISEDWLLIHDDWEDGSKERRGKPTLHRLYSPELAVNAGDALHMLMWKVLYDNIDFLGIELTTKLINEFYQMLTRAALGQTVEIKWTQENKLDLTDNDWFFIADGKTSYYTIAGPMRLGAIIAGANNSQLDILFKFGNYLGRCFQIVDDILDVTSDFRGLKKQQGNDVYEGKRTIMLSHLLRNASSNDKKRLKMILAKSRDKKTERDVLWVINRMQHYRSIEYAKSVAKKLANKSNEMFEKELKFLKSEPARSQLKAGINFILQRDF